MSQTTRPETMLPKLERSLLWRLKLRLQFTGWLQFMLPAILTVACLLLAALGGLLGGWSLLSQIPLALSAASLALFAFDVATVKYNLRPTEAVPVPRDRDAFDLMRSRRSCRSFQTRDLTEAHRQALLAWVEAHTRPEALLGEHPIRFEYVAAPLTVWPVIGAHEFLVAIAPKTYSRAAVIDVGRSLQKVVLEATRHGLATCWIGPGADQKSIVAHLGERFDPQRDHVICVCAVGYASRYKPTMIRLMTVAQHRRLPLSELFFADPHFRQPLDTTAPPLSDFGRCYEVCQWSPSSYNSQTTRCAAVTGPDGLARFDFGSATASRYYAAVALGIWCANWEVGCEALGIDGRFMTLTEAERGIAGAPELPGYDVSWVLAEAR